jgi:hypothetical protein
MVYLARKNGEVIHHTNLSLMREWDAVDPEMELTEEQWAAHGGLARVIDGEIFLGKTEEEAAAENAKAEIKRIKAEIAGRDYRVLKAQKLGEDLDTLYPGETDWYKQALADIGNLERTAQVVEPEFKA